MRRKRVDAAVLDTDAARTGGLFPIVDGLRHHRRGDVSDWVGFLRYAPNTTGAENDAGNRDGLYDLVFLVVVADPGHHDAFVRPGKVLRHFRGADDDTGE